MRALRSFLAGPGRDRAPGRTELGRGARFLAVNGNILPDWSKDPCPPTTPLSPCRFLSSLTLPLIKLYICASIFLLLSGLVYILVLQFSLFKLGLSS